jgi:hypothetical protein
VLVVEREAERGGSGDAVRVRITIDRGATRAAKFRSKQQVRRARGGKDPGGDVVL